MFRIGCWPNSSCKPNSCLIPTLSLDDPRTQPWEIFFGSYSEPGTRNSYQAETSRTVRDDNDVTPELRRRRDEDVGSHIYLEWSRMDPLRKYTRNLWYSNNSNSKYISNLWKWYLKFIAVFLSTAIAEPNNTVTITRPSPHRHIYREILKALLFTAVCYIIVKRASSSKIFVLNKEELRPTFLISSLYCVFHCIILFL